MNNTKEKKSGFDRNPELIMRYRAGEAEAGDELVTLNTPLIYSIAGRFCDRGADMSDLVECGTMGLVKAIKTFDFSKNCAFSTYAVPLIFGEIRRFLRDDGMIKVSREEKRLCSLLSREKQRRQNEGQVCDIASLALAVGISVEDAASALFSESPVRSLDESVYDDDDSTTLGSTVSDEDEEERCFNKLALRCAIEKLDKESRKIIILRYFKDYSQARTAEVMGLSQVKVSREEKKIIARLRDELI